MQITTITIILTCYCCRFLFICYLEGKILFYKELTKQAKAVKMDIDFDKLGLEIIDKAEFEREFRLQTIQRCLKAIGTFSNQIANRNKENYRQYINPMFKIVLRACENLDRFPNLQAVIWRSL